MIKNEFKNKVNFDKGMVLPELILSMIFLVAFFDIKDLFSPIVFKNFRRLRQKFEHDLFVLEELE